MNHTTLILLFLSIATVFSCDNSAKKEPTQKQPALTHKRGNDLLVYQPGWDEIFLIAHDGSFTLNDDLYVREYFKETIRFRSVNDENERSSVEPGGNIIGTSILIDKSEINKLVSKKPNGKIRLDAANADRILDSICRCLPEGSSDQACVGSGGENSTQCGSAKNGRSCNTYCRSGYFSCCP